MISIITITYNNYEQLIDTLNSIPKENYIESIVINGGECQRTKEFLKTYSGKSVTEKDQGIADAFNKGVRLSSGDFIMFLNSGDILLEPNYLQSAIKIFQEKSQVQFVHSNLLFLDKSGLNLLMKPTLSNLGRGLPYLHPTMIVRKNLFNLIGLFDTSIIIAMDFDWVARMRKEKIIGYYIDGNPVVKMDGDGKSVVNEHQALVECFNILRKHNLLTAENTFGFIKRYLLFLGRKFLKISGMNGLLIKLKKKKYSYKN